jgi:hypothetical protein
VSLTCDFGAKASGGSGGSVGYDGPGWLYCDGFPSDVKTRRVQAKSNAMAVIVAMNCTILYYV